MSNSSSATTPAGAASSAALFSPKQVGIATFLGNAMTGGLLLAINYWRMNKGKEAWVTWITSWVITAIVFGLAMLLPAAICNGMYIGQAVGATYAAKALQEKVFIDHVNNGGRKASGWAVFGIGMGGMTLMLAIILGLYFANPDFFLTSVAVSPKEKVYYSERATKEEATKLGAALKESGFFNGEKEANVEYVKNLDGSKVITLYLASGWDDPEVMAYMEELGKQLAPSVGGPPLHIKIFDTSNNEKKDIEIK